MTTTYSIYNHNHNHDRPSHTCTTFERLRAYLTGAKAVAGDAGHLHCVRTVTDGDDSYIDTCNGEEILHTGESAFDPA